MITKSMELNTRNSKSFVGKNSRQSIDKNGQKKVPTRPEERLSTALKKLIEINDKTKRLNAIKIVNDMEEEKKKAERKKKLPNVIHNVLLMRRAKKNFEKNAGFDESKKENDLPSNFRNINAYNDADDSDGSSEELKYSDVYDDRQNKIMKSMNYMKKNDNNDNTTNTKTNLTPKNLTWENMISHRTPYASEKKAKKERQIIISKLRLLQKEKKKNIVNPIRIILNSRGPKEKTENEISGTYIAMFFFRLYLHKNRIQLLITFSILYLSFLSYIFISDFALLTLAIIVFEI